ncbi:sensor domain-containing diguanylate cyclase [Pseudoduganella lutea]|uniref:diguanylate cyclase n=1 Tax=Pseudoduganella lutea TaxID=321985 RepID=A0A4V0Z434_9BURK|nr:sensor domain-containing diguanylate cyclase [Pseudoduganella lutea]QBE65553.1 sensor domain-containing diguanylate cyclase [Pseudoduganella lutea]
MINDFAAAAQATMAHLRRRLGLQLWMVTRTEGDDWIVLHVDEADGAQGKEHGGYGVKPGLSLPWTDTFCSRMVLGHGPGVAPATADVPAYAHVPMADKLPTGAYVGVPLRRSDGSLFGTLCGIDPRAQPDALRDELDTLNLMGELLSKILGAELDAGAESRRADRVDADATRDPLTGLVNRRGWELLVEREEERCSRYGHSACVVSLDVDDLQFTNDTQGTAAGDSLLIRTARALESVTRGTDTVARLGGDEFAMLMVECDYFDAQALLLRVQEALAAADVRAALGMALRKPGYDLEETFAMADAEMGRAKQSRKVLN